MTLRVECSTCLVSRAKKLLNTNWHRCSHAERRTHLLADEMAALVSGLGYWFGMDLDIQRYVIQRYVIQ